MHAHRTFVALSIVTLLAACASPGGTQSASMTTHAHQSTAAMQPRMKAMHEMHQKMKNASTPAERQALMAEHMKAIQDGMAMLKEMHAMHSGGAAGGMGMGMGTGMMASQGSAAPAGEMAKRHQMMADHMATMQMLIDMMADRMPRGAPGQ